MFNRYHKVGKHGKSSYEIWQISSNDDFINSLCYLVADIRNNDFLCRLLINFIGLYTFLQSYLVFMYPSMTSFWSKSPQCKYIINIISVFTRIAFQGTSSIGIKTIVYTESVIFIFCGVLLVWLIYSHRPSKKIAHRASTILFFLPVILLRCLFFPNVGLCTYCLSQCMNPEYGMTVIFFSFINAVLCLFGHSIVNWSVLAFPNYPNSFGITYYNLSMYIAPIYCGTLFSTAELISMTENRALKTIYILINALLCLNNTLDDVKQINSTTMFCSIINALTQLMGCLTNICILISLYQPLYPEQVICLILILALPAYYICKKLCYDRLQYVVGVVYHTTQTKDFSIMDKWSPIMVVAALGHAFPHIAGDWSVFEWALNKFPNDFEVCAEYARFLMLSGQNPAKPLDMIRRVKSISIFNQVTIQYFKILMFRNNRLNYFSEICESRIQDYMINLNLFWSEILLGKTEKIIALSSEAFKSYSRTQLIFSHFGKQVELVQRFNKFWSLSIDDKWSKQKIQHAHYYQQNYNTTSFKENEFEVFTPTLIKEKTIEAHQRNVSYQLFKVEHLIFYIPFIYIMFMLLFITFNTEKRWKKDMFSTFDMLHNISSLLYLYGATYSIYPYYPIRKDERMNHSFIRSHMHNNRLFKTRLDNPKSDMIDILINIKDKLHYFAKVSELCAKKSKSFGIMLNESTVNMSSYLYDGTTYDLTFMSYLYIHLMRLENIYYKSEEEIFSHIHSSIHKYFSNEAVYAIDMLSSFIKNIVKKNYKVAHSMINRIKVQIKFMSIILAIIGIIATFLLEIRLLKLFKKLYSPLFNIPKNSISELINKFKSRQPGDAQFLSTEESKTKYFINQLSYERPSTHYYTTLKYFYTVLFINVLLISVFGFSLYPIMRQIFSTNLKTAKSIKSLRYTAILPAQLFELGHFIFQVINRKLKGIPVDVPLVDRLINNSLEFQELYPKIVEKVSKTKYPFGASRFLAQIDADHTKENTMISFSFVGQYSYMLSNLFKTLGTYSKTKDFDFDELNSLVASLFAAITLPTPEYTDILFDNITNYVKYTTMIFHLCLLVYIMVIFMMIIIEKNYLTPFILDPEFSVPVFQTIPITEVPMFAQILQTKANVTNDSNEVLRNAFEDKKSFDFVSQMIICIDSDDYVVLSTPITTIKLQLDRIDGEFFPDILETLNIHEVKLPPTENVSFEFEIAETNSTLQANVIISKGLEFQGKKIAYICVIEDHTSKYMMENRYNGEYNRLKMLMAQMIPPSVLPSALESLDLEPIIMQKVVVLSVFVSTPNSLETLFHIETIVRSNLTQFKSLSFFGRSIQLFRVISGVNDRSMTATEQSVELVKFSIAVLKEFNHLKSTTDSRFDVYTGIHITGPQQGEMVSEKPPIFDLASYSSSISIMTAVQCSPNQVNVTREVAKSILGQGFVMSFENEISFLNGEIQPIHQVHLDG